MFQELLKEENKEGSYTCMRHAHMGMFWNPNIYR